MNVLLAGRLGAVDQLDPLGLAVLRGVDLFGGDLPILGVRTVGLGRAFLEPHDDLLAREPPGRELGLEPDGVVDEDDVVDQQLGQLQVARRLGAAQADRCRAAPPCGPPARPPMASGSPSVVWPSVSITIAEGAAPAAR